MWGSSRGTLWEKKRLRKRDRAAALGLRPGGNAGATGIKGRLPTLELGLMFVSPGRPPAEGNLDGKKGYRHS